MASSSRGFSRFDLFPSRPQAVLVEVSLTRRTIKHAAAPPPSAHSGSPLPEAAHLPSHGGQGQTSRASPASDTTKDLFTRAQSEAPMLSVAPEYDASTGSLTSKATVAPASARTQSPAPLAWNESGWNAGHFTFSPFASATSGTANDDKADERRSSWGSSASGLGAIGTARSLSASTTDGNKVRATVESSKTGGSRLAPTAQPFVFSPKPPQAAPAASSPSCPRLSPIDTSIANEQSGHLAFPSTAASFSPSPVSPLEPLQGGAPRFNENSRLVDQGSQYEIADEILHLQGQHVTNGFGERSAPDSRTRTLSEADRAVDAWTIQQQQFYNSNFAKSPFERSRSSSIASTSSFFGPPRPSYDRNATVQQLNSYFGSSPVEVAPPILPAGFDNFTPNSYSAPASRNSSFSGPDSQVYPPLAHPEPFNLTPQDPLYLQARDIYIKSCCSSLKVVPPIAKLWEIGDHFDKAMNQENPLAALYGVPAEQTKGFYANPANSGINELVVKVAAMRGRQNQMLSVQRSAAGQILPGPSPNNRKLELYKTELCRSWEEKGTCRYGFKCQFAHGREEQREIARHPKFKSELCRTFAVQGSCPYGRRCCFIHQALPAGGAGPSTAAQASDSPSEPVSRLAHRMTSTAVAGAPHRNFGPSLSSYLGSSSTNSSSSGSALSSLTNSPTQAFRPQLAPMAGHENTLVSDPFGEAGVGLGLSLKIGQAPPVHQEPPKSRLERFSISSRNSSSSLASLAHSSSGTTSPVAGFQPHARTNSNNSTFSSVSSALSGMSSPCLQRHGSQSSLSSSGTPSSPLALRPLGSHWLEHHGSPDKAHVFDWPETEDLVATEDQLGSPVASRFGGLSLY
ncbi:hypothetical protein JCM10212_004126 [Sporobolomyces blumeae]